MRGAGLTLFLCVCAILAFAGNSLIARAALADGAIEAGAFSVIRLTAGALVLLPFLGVRPGFKDAPGAMSLTVYVVGFSLAYLTLGAGIGALILFACVQATIVAAGYWRGEALSAAGWAGMILALGGLAVLLFPSADSAAVSVSAALLMAIAGAAWGIYTLIGRSSGDPAGSTARNFLLAAPLSAPMLLFDHDWPSGYGIMLAVIAGAVTSGMGYVIWYKVTPRLGLGTVASVQLATPVAAAFGGVLLLLEAIDWRLLAGGALILSGIVLTFLKPRGESA